MFHEEVNIATLCNACYILADQCIAGDKYFVTKMIEQSLPQTPLI